MTRPSKSVIVGTAGHIDHGKSSLIEALTGTHPDRLEEEKRRGITLDRGFAFREEDGVRYGFGDVPGHELFVKNRIAGSERADKARPGGQRNSRTDAHGARRVC